MEEEYDEPCLSFLDRHEIVCLLKGLHLVQKQARYGLEKAPDFVPRPGRVNINKVMLQTSKSLETELRKILATFFKDGG